jgi:hypothetical protein
VKKKKKNSRTRNRDPDYRIPKGKIVPSEGEISTEWKKDTVRGLMVSLSRIGLRVREAVKMERDSK